MRKLGKTHPKRWSSCWNIMVEWGGQNILGGESSILRRWWGVGVDRDIPGTERRPRWVREGHRKGWESEAEVQPLKAQTLKAVWGSLLSSGVWCATPWTPWPPGDPRRLLSAIRIRRLDTYEQTPPPHTLIWGFNVAPCACTIARQPLIGNQDDLRSSLDPCIKKKKWQAHAHIHLLDYYHFPGEDEFSLWQWNPCNFPRALVNKIHFVRIWEIL